MYHAFYPGQERIDTARFIRRGKHYLVTSVTTGYLPDPTLEEQARMSELQRLLPPNGAIDTSLTRYVWLPFRFEGDMGILDRRDQWTLDEFD